MSPRKPMKPRSIRAGKEWEDAVAAADERGENLSEEIRKFLVQYGKKAGKK